MRASCSVDVTLSRAEISASVATAGHGALNGAHVVHEQRGEQCDVERERAAQLGGDAHSSRP